MAAAVAASPAATVTAAAGSDSESDLVRGTESEAVRAAVAPDRGPARAAGPLTGQPERRGPAAGLSSHVTVRTVT